MHEGAGDGAGDGASGGRRAADRGPASATADTLALTRPRPRPRPTADTQAIADTVAVAGADGPPGLSDADTLIAEPAGAQTQPEGRPRGSLIGRYVVLDRLGAGGMGVIHAAYDPELDRKVAIKLLRTSAGVGPEQLLHEAKAMARLSHPNVIAVFDVGAVGDEVFVAMEIVDGVTLRAWLAERPRRWREVLDVMLAAGRGLQAAHDAGLVHRDFKPENVMIDRAGRARVMDFGLAQAERREGAATIGGDIFRTGALVGTPAYMAPEQYTGGPVDGRADLFAFCVTLWEAIYGQHPFLGPTVMATADAILDGRIVAAPREGVAPKWLHRALLRGLQPALADRFAGMAELLAALDRDLRPALVRASLGLTAALVVAAIVAAIVALTRPGTVEVVVTAEGRPLAPSAVTVDGEALMIADNHAHGSIAAGRRLLEVRAPGHRASATAIEVTRGDALHITLDLQRTTGAFDLQVEPTGASVLLDGDDYGSRLRGLLIPTGAHALLVRRDGYYQQELAWEAVEGETRAGFVGLAPAVIWTQPASGILYPMVTVGDLDDNGISEVMTRVFNEVTIIDPWSPHVFFQRRIGGVERALITAADLDGDGRAELILGAEDDPQRVELWAPDPTQGYRRRWQSPRLGGDQDLIRQVALLEIDGDGVLDVIAGGDAVVAFSGATGAALWRQPLGAGGALVELLPLGPAVAVIQERRRSALDRRGAPLWSLALADDDHPLIRGRVIDDGGPALVLAHQRADGGQVLARIADDGGIAWSWATAGRFTAPDLAFPVEPVGEAPEAVLITRIVDGEPVALDAATGAVLWQDPEASALIPLPGLWGGPARVGARLRDGGLAIRRPRDGAQELLIDPPGAPIRLASTLDWDGDGAPELVITDQGGTLAALDRHGRRRLSLWSELQPSGAVVLGDLDGDRLPELGIVGRQGFGVVRGPRVRWQRLAQESLRATPLVVDLDGDGRDEAVLTGAFPGSDGLIALDPATGGARVTIGDGGLHDFLRPLAPVPRADGGHDLIGVSYKGERGGLVRFSGRDGRVVAESAAGAGYASPTVTDLDGDGDLEVLNLGWAADLWVHDADTLELVRRVPIEHGSWVAPQVAREGGRLRVVFGRHDGALQALGDDLQPLWLRPPGEGPVIHPPVLADLDGDGTSEVIHGRVDGSGALEVLRLATGEPRWSRDGVVDPNGWLAVGDLDGDGLPEIVTTSASDGAIAFDPAGGERWRYAPWPRWPSQPRGDAPPVIADLDGDGTNEVLVTFRNGWLCVIDGRRGDERWRHRLLDTQSAPARQPTGRDLPGLRLEASPAVLDVDGDGRREVLVAGHNRALLLLDGGFGGASGR